ncbi:MAG: biotin synthase BioB [Planctomycetota bacterium]
MPEVSDIAERALASGQVTRDEALWLAREADFEELLCHANRIRERFHGNVVHLCSIINARSGACSEDCKFCSQSAHHSTNVAVHPLVSQGEIVDAARAAVEIGADSFGVVTSGGSACNDRGDFDAICAAAKEVDGSTDATACVSIGMLSPDDAQRLAAAGVRRINHNLETSARFFPEICSTHSHADRAGTVGNAKAAGLEVCCGGIFGLGETWDDRVDLALQLRDLDVDAIPINFLNPIPGTPLERRPLLEPREALRIIAVYRFVHPPKEIKVCGGREIVLRDLQSWMFRAGASGTMLGNYLTTAGRSPGDDLRMLADLGLTPRNRSQEPRSKRNTSAK